MVFPQYRLGDVCRLINGRAYKKHEMLSEGPYPLLRVGNFFTNRNWFYSDLELGEDKYCDNGDLLYAWSASFGPRIWEGQKVIYHYHIWKIEVDKTIADKRYLYHLLDWDTEQIKLAQGAGTTMVHVTKGSMENRVLPFPPIPEQKRIVAILDQAFADIDKARANAEQNLKNARELFDSYLHQVFSKRGEGWVDEIMGNVCDVRDGTHDSPKYVEEGVPFVTQKNIRKGGLSFEKTKFISESDHAKFYNRSNVTHGDILISMIGVNRGMACVVDDHRIFSIKNVGLIKKVSNINPYFLLFYLKSQFALRYIEAESRGGAQPFIGLTKLRAFPILLASLEEQNDVASQLKSVETHSENLVTAYQNKLEALDELKKSILQKAFSGELTKGEGMAA